MIAVLVIVTMLSMLSCYMIAKVRSADRFFWTLMGLLLGPLAIPFAFFARPKAPTIEDE